LLFDEKVDAKWFGGFSLVMVGVFLLSTVQPRP
jgi:multidrug transporter EmrE-like cation transporter